MTPSNTCLQLISSSEGFRSAPYRCPAGVATIGYGSTFYADGRRVEMDDLPITEPEARFLLCHEAEKLADQIAAASKVELERGQLDALVSFAYNAGLPALLGSTLWRKLQAGDLVGAAAQFPLWVKGGKPKRVIPGLVTRRAAERELFEGATA